MAVTERGTEKLDQEWVALMIEAKELGLGTEMVRNFLRNNENAVLQAAAK